MLQSDPYLMEKDGGYQGYCVDLAKLLSESFPFNYELRLVRDGKYGAEGANNKWSGMIGELIRKVSV